MHVIHTWQDVHARHTHRVGLISTKVNVETFVVELACHALSQTPQLLICRRPNSQIPGIVPCVRRARGSDGHGVEQLYPVGDSRHRHSSVCHSRCDVAVADNRRACNWRVCEIGGGGVLHLSEC
jgi:hypothetical protein